MTNINNIVQLERAKFWKNKGILFCEIFNHDESHQLNDTIVDSYLKTISTLCQGEKMPFLIDLRNTCGTFLSSAARKLGDSYEMSNFSLTEAYVANSLKVKLLIISYKRIYEPNTPFAIFNDYNDALEYSINSKNRNNGSK